MGSSVHSYVYARASGILARSFVGKRTEKLFEVQNLSGLWTLIFKEEVPHVPETLLAQQLEKHAKETFINEYMLLLKAYSKPDLVTVKLLQYYDYINLKIMIGSVRAGASKPNIVSLKDFAFLKYDEYPLLSGVTHNSKVSWLSQLPEVSEEKNVERRLDSEYMKDLWLSIKKLPLNERSPVQKLLQKDLIFQNIIWAIRLRLYYNMRPEEVLLRLIKVTEGSVTQDPIAGPASRIVNFSMTSFDDWQDWEYAYLLNPNEEGVVWTIDPCWVENMAKNTVLKIAQSQFHQNPFSSAFLVAWFKIKQQELNYIRTATESLRLNISPENIKKML
ncbi:MAG: V0D/AC39 family V-type ATPase subunit [Treponemataceae bacterium]